MTLQLPIEEYFKYHPPTTPERIALHNRVNRECLEICKAFIDSKDNVGRLAIRDAAILLANEVCEDRTCVEWAMEAAQQISQTASIDDARLTDSRNTAILMRCQQFRMFLNQGIMVDELKQQQLAEGMAAVTTEDIAEVFRMHGERIQQEAVKEARASNPLESIWHPPAIDRFEILGSPVDCQSIEEAGTIDPLDIEEAYGIGLARESLPQYLRQNANRPRLPLVNNSDHLKNLQPSKIVVNTPLEVTRKLGFRDRLKVRLTDFGRAELARQHREISEHIGKERIYTPKAEDELGMSDWSIEDLMCSFAHLMSPGNEMCFEEDLWVPLLDYDPSNPPLVGGMVSGSPEAMEKFKQRRTSDGFPVHEGATRQMLATQNAESVFADTAAYLADDEFDIAIAISISNGIWQAGIAGSDGEVDVESSGKDPIAALTNLYATLKGIEFTELKNSSGGVYSTSIKSIAIDPETIEKYKEFLEAYGNAIANLDANGLSDRDTLIAGLIAAEEDEQIGGGYVVPNQPYNYRGIWSSERTYKQFDSVRCDGIRYYWANPKQGNSAPPSEDWEAI